MSPDQIIVTLLGIILIAAVVWFFWGPKGEGEKADTSNREQRIRVNVEGAYSPDRILAEAGKPLIIEFLRTETSSCTELVTFPDLDIAEPLPTNELVEISLPPLRPGRYTFQCGMAMVRGDLIIT
jgi:plastocyanin domain-containing protein